jgi:hypothetical protein
MGGFQKLNEGNQRGMRGEFEKPNEETDWEGHEKPNDRNGLTGMRNWMRWEWDGNETGWEEKPNDDGNDRGMKPNEMIN